MMRRRNKMEVFLHFVWTTWERRPLISDEIEASLYRCLITQAVTLGAEVLALNGMPDHVHLAVRFPATISIAAFMKQVKGVSSSFVRDNYGTEHFFRW